MDLDPAPAIFVIDLQDANKSFSAILLYEGTPVYRYHFPKIKSHTEVTKQ
jgi:hypothetical protein